MLLLPLYLLLTSMIATLAGGPSQMRSLTQRTFTLSFTFSNWCLGLEFHSDESVKENSIFTEQVKCRLTTEYQGLTTDSDPPSLWLSQISNSIPNSLLCLAQARISL